LVEINLSSANVDDDRLGRANELVDETAASVRRATDFTDEDELDESL
jgi:hypothetical protein